MNAEIEARVRRTVGQMRAFGRDLKREDVLRVVAGIDAPQLGEAANEQARRDEQHERERGLADDEHVARPVAPARRSAGAVAQAREVRRRRPKRGDGAARERREEDRAQRDEPGEPGDAHVAEARDAVRRRAKKHGQREIREADGEQAREHRDDHRLRHLQPDELAARRADRATHRQVALAALGAHHEQVRDVGAGDQQHDRDRAEEHPERTRHAAEQLLVERAHDRAMLADHARVCRRAAESLRQSFAQGP